VGDAHGVEHAAARGGGCGEVGVAVEVQQPGTGIVALGPGDDAEGDRAVAAQDQRQRPVGQRVGDGIGDARATRTTVARLRAVDAISSATNTSCRRSPRSSTVTPSARSRSRNPALRNAAGAWS
jgi:hypothetical protein